MAKSIDTDVITQGNLFISPIEFFCGDNVSLSYDFVVSEGTFQDLYQTGIINITSQEEIAEIIKIDPSNFTIKELTLTSTGTNVNLKLNCVLWKTGNIQLPPISLPLENEILEIHVPQFTVSSILEKTNSTSIRPYKGPVTIPGTTYLLWGQILILAGLLAGLIVALVKISKIIAFVSRQNKKRRYRKNYRKTLFRLKLLSKSSASFSDQNYCNQLQVILRDYLAVRFTDEIYNLTTSEIIKWFDGIFSRLSPDTAGSIITHFYKVMNRCDYIRFSGDSIPESLMQENEREILLKETTDIVNLFERGIMEC
ncbi:MAG: hypothetical protein K5839_06340 [Treponemataceae bacterium]|nr:hypothetical protein [Treponemataceae bacterium]